MLLISIVDIYVCANIRESIKNIAVEYITDSARMFISLFL